MFGSKHKIYKIVDSTEHEQKIHIIVLEKYSFKNGNFLNVSEQYIVV